MTILSHDALKVKRPASRPTIRRCSRCWRPLVSDTRLIAGTYHWIYTCPRCPDFGCDGGSREIVIRSLAARAAAIWREELDRDDIYDPFEDDGEVPR